MVNAQELAPPEPSDFGACVETIVVEPASDVDDNSCLRIALSNGTPMYVTTSIHSCFCDSDFYAEDK